MSAANHRPNHQTTKLSLPLPTSATKTNSLMPKTFGMRYPWLQTGFERAGDTWKEKTTFDDGQGLLSGRTWGEQFNRKIAAAKQRDLELDERHRSLQRMLRSVDDVFSCSPYLNQKLLAAATEKMSAAAERTFLKYKMFCETWELPFLPETAPQAITLFVLDNAANAREAKRIVNCLAEAYDKLSPRPWRDPLVTVVIETLTEPETEEKE